MLHCHQEIPCNPCSSVCPKGSITMQGHPIMGKPAFEGACTGCARCAMICPGLAVTIVDGRKDPEQPLVTVPFEQPRDKVQAGDTVLATDVLGVPIGRFEVVDVKDRKIADHTVMVRLRVPVELAPRVAGFRTQTPEELLPVEPPGDEPVADDVIICRCEHVSAGEIRAAIRDGVRDVNELKAQLRVCMGACCGKNCPEHLVRIFRQEGVEPGAVTPNTIRPLFVEVPFGVFARGGGER